MPRNQPQGINHSSSLGPAAQLVRLALHWPRNCWTSRTTKPKLPFPSASGSPSERSNNSGPAPLFGEMLNTITARMQPQGTPPPAAAPSDSAADEPNADQPSSLLRLVGLGSLVLGGSVAVVATMRLLGFGRSSSAAQQRAEDERLPPVEEEAAWQYMPWQEGEISLEAWSMACEELGRQRPEWNPLMDAAPLTWSVAHMAACVEELRAQLEEVQRVLRGAGPSRAETRDAATSPRRPRRRMSCSGASDVEL